MSRALLVIDVQKEYFSGALPITHPTNHLENILAIYDIALQKRIPIAVVQHHQPSPDSPIFRKGSSEWELHPEIAARSCDIHIEKQWPGAFTDTPLADWLLLHRVKTVTIAGYMTHMCCDTTARQAMHQGYKVEFMADATGTLSLDNAAGKVTAEELHRSILCAQQMMISEVISTQNWIARISEQIAS
ncbi:MAG: cysteine hydrolase [Pirellula sp.]|jgi:nicotinamidase-related amidase|nr:cysteine hydrolase [Pirellula sp.]